MTTYQIVCFLGIPSLWLSFTGFLFSMVKKSLGETKALKTGTQALLRAQMISDYNHWLEKGYAPIYARENFLNCWQQYHELGANGVMDDIKEKFMDLPTKKAGD